VKIQIKPFSAVLLKDFLYFFDRVAFTDNPDWAGCYCYYYHIFCSDAEWDRRMAKDNRNATKKLLVSGEMRGFLAYVEGKTIGWCNANRKENYPRLVNNNEICSSGQDSIISVVCFVVAPGFRRRGVARKLLRAVCTDSAKGGYDYVEAYPRREALSEAHNYHGPLSLYEQEGFYIHKECDNLTIVRRKL
jgi:ribosomal protein S18 acetylase RimI-like enzyme